MKQSKHYDEMFSTEYILIVNKDLKKAVDYANKKYKIKMEYPPENSEGGHWCAVKRKPYHCYEIMLIEKKDLELAAHELFHAIQSTADAHRLRYGGEWMAYYNGFLLNKLWKGLK